jgi:hypothetical protein
MRRVTASTRLLFLSVFMFLGLASLTSGSQAQLSPLISAPGRVDMVYEDSREVLYITNGAEIRRYHVPSNTLLAPITLPGGGVTPQLKGIDVSPDGNLLAVADRSYANEQVWVWLVNLNTGAAWKQTFPRAFYEGGTFTVAFGNDGSVVVTSYFEGSGSVPMRRFHPAMPGSAGVIASVSMQTMLAANGPRDIIAFAEPNSSDGPVGRLRVADSNLLRKSGYSDGTSWFNYEVGVNRTGTQYAFPTYGGAFIYDANLQKTGTVIGTYAQAHPMGVVYHPTKDIVYFAWATTTTVRAYDTNTWQLVGQYDFQNTFDHPGNWAFTEGRLKISKDGSLLFATVAGGVRCYRVPNGVNAENLFLSGIEDQARAVRLIGSAYPRTVDEYQVVTNPSRGTLSGTAPDLIYTPNRDFNGIDTFTYRVRAGADWSNTASVTLRYQPVNDAPSFTPGPNVEVIEDSGAHTLPGWATNLSKGPADEAGQSLIGEASTTDGHLFAASPTFGPDGSLRFTVAPNAAGVAKVSVRLKDSGGTFNGGVDASAWHTLTITVRGVNDAPSFAPGGDQTVAEDAGPQSLAWASGILAGPPDEAGQSLRFVVTTDKPGLFSAQPSVAADGTLTYTPAPNAHGSAQVTVTLVDDGGTDGGGVDSSAAATFTITVTEVNDAPTAAADAASTTQQTPVVIAVLANDTDVDGDRLSITSVSASAGGTVTRSADGTLTYTPSKKFLGTDSFTYTVSDGRGGFATGTVTVSVAGKPGGGKGNGPNR